MCGSRKSKSLTNLRGVNVAPFALQHCVFENLESFEGVMGRGGRDIPSRCPMTVILLSHGFNVGPQLSNVTFARPGLRVRRANTWKECEQIQASG
jgi:hypothetical protein